MNPRAEIEALRTELDRLTRSADPDMAQRYALWHPPGQRRTLYRRLRKAFGRLLRRLNLRPTQRQEPWSPTLRHAEYSDSDEPVVIWALGMNREELEQACRSISRLLDVPPRRVPVLVTDVAHFAFYSRLGWLVEYIPSLGAPADGYRERKRRYLASRYRDAPALPASIGLAEKVKREELLVD